MWKCARFGVLVLAVALAAGCHAPQPRNTWFDPAEYAKFAGVGTGRVEGQAFVRTLGGDVKYAAGLPVYMNPVTTYSTEWYDRSIVGGESLAESDYRANPFHRQGMGDGEGRFVFTDLPPGDYYIASPISWMIPGPYGLQETGGVAHARVTVKEGETSRVIVTR